MYCNGLRLKENIPFFAHQMFLDKLLVLTPNNLSGRKYGTPTCLKPTHALSPLKKISFSENLVKYLTTFLSIKEKSPASIGILTSDRLRKIR